MYHRGEKKEHVKSNVSHHLEVAELLGLLETNDNQMVEEIKMLIHEQLHNTKEAWLLHGLVDCYINSQSSRCLEIIVGVREPHDKHLFDKLADCLKGASRYPALLLLGHLVRRHPSWLHKISQHRIMHILLNVLKTDTVVPNLISAVLVVVTLLPTIPSLVGSHLPDIFESFSRLAAWNAKKPGNIPEIYILHLQVGVYALFHRLYAMYPCNFLAYLRSYYGRREQNQESFSVFTKTIKPMLERVRLHPLLVTASKETELTTTRWKKMEIHDIVVECAKVSLDLIEGTREDVPCENYWNMRSSQIASGRHSFSALNAHKDISYSGLTPASPKSIVKEAFAKCQTTDSDYMWSPSFVCGLITPAPQLNTSLDVTNTSTGIVTTISHSDQGQATHSPPVVSKMGESPPLDMAVEAKPEEASVVNLLETSASSVSLVQDEVNSILVPLQADNITMEESEVDMNIEQNCLDNSQSEDQLTPTGDSSKSSLPDVSQAEEAREEEIIDKEVSEIVSNSKVSYSSPSEDLGHDTPFFSTTQKLTDEPQTPCDLSLSDTAQMSSQSQEEEYETSKDCKNMEAFMRSINRLRYYSYRGPPPTEITIDYKPERSLLKRFYSCPELHKEEDSARSEVQNGEKDDSSCNIEQQPLDGSHIVSVSCMRSINSISENINSVESTSAFVPVQNTVYSQTTYENTHFSSPYSHLFPIALEPLPVPQSVISRDCTKLVPTLRPTPLVSHSVESSASSSYGEIPFYTTVSPPELLDRHLQLGNDIHVKKLNIPLTSTNSTDWTHFGGQAPADEISILRGQILLLHNQLLFERHKREIHAERNRRLLGKAKWTWMLEEQNGAMKDQLKLQEKEIQSLIEKVEALSNECHKWNEKKDHQDEQLNQRLRVLTHENITLEQSSIKINEQLIKKKQENDILRSELRKVRSQLSETRLEREAAFRQVDRYQKLEDDAKRLSKEVLLLSEMNQHYRERIENLHPQPSITTEEALWKESARSEILALKQKLETKNVLLDASKARIAQLENTVANNNLLIEEQKQLIETIKQCHLDVLQTKESKLNTLQKIWEQQEMYILELQQKLETAEYSKSTPLHKTKTVNELSSSSQMSTIDTSVIIDNSVPSGFNSPDSTKETVKQEVITSPTNFISQQHIIYQNLENCVNDIPGNNDCTLQSHPVIANSNGCALDSN